MRRKALPLGPPIKIEFHDEELLLLPHKALYWANTQTLVLADPHFGKTATFRHHGLPVPEGSISADLKRLQHALELTGARRLVVLGDLLHSRAGRTPAVVQTVHRWRERYANVEFLLVRGNHDKGAGDPPSEWHVDCVDEPFYDGPFVFLHSPSDEYQSYAMAGHIHPSVLLHGPAGAEMRAPCFWFRKHCVVLPAFGSFTGSFNIRPRAGERVYAVGEGEVVEVHRRLFSSTLK